LSLQFVSDSDVDTNLSTQVVGIGLGPSIMSNIFLSASLIFLASEEAGCLNETGDEVLEDCDKKIYGFKPASLISNIAVISGVLSALFMPIAGAIIDYSPYRKQVGVITAVLMMMIETAQIGTVSRTWFAMSILLAVSGVLYQVETLATRAYLPETACTIGESAMTICTYRCL